MICSEDIEDMIPPLPGRSSNVEPLESVLSIWQNLHVSVMLPFRAFTTENTAYLLI